MAAFDRIRALLEPLKLYSFDEGSIGGAELYAAASAIDDFAAALDAAERELSPFTAGEEGIALYEQLLGLFPPGDLERRRRSVLVQLAANGEVGIDGLGRILAACGLEVGIREAGGECIEVFFPGVPGEPADFDRVRAIIDRFLPCHLEPVFVFNYITWAIFERIFPTWRTLDASGMSWREIELIIE